MIAEDTMDDNNLSEAVKNENSSSVSETSTMNNVGNTMLKPLQRVEPFVVDTNKTVHSNGNDSELLSVQNQALDIHLLDDEVDDGDLLFNVSDLESECSDVNDLANANDRDSALLGETNITRLFSITDMEESSSDMSHIDLRAYYADITKLTGLYKKLYKQDPSLKEEILKMYALDQILDKLDRDYTILCKKRPTSVSPNNAAKLELKTKSKSNVGGRKHRLATAAPPGKNLKPKTPLIAKRKIKSAAVNPEVNQALAQMENENSSAYLTADEQQRLENILQNNEEAVMNHYQPDDETNKLLDVINNKLKSYSFQNAAELNDKQEKVADISTVNLHDLEAARTELDNWGHDLEATKSELENWGHDLDSKMQLIDIDKQLKLLQQNSEQEVKTPFSETELKSLVQESLESLNKATQSNKIDEISQPSEVWTISNETLQKLLHSTNCDLGTKFTK